MDRYCSWPGGWAPFTDLSLLLGCCLLSTSTAKSTEMSSPLPSLSQTLAILEDSAAGLYTQKRSYFLNFYNFVLEWFTLYHSPVVLQVKILLGTEVDCLRAATEFYTHYSLLHGSYIPGLRTQCFVPNSNRNSHHFCHSCRVSDTMPSALDAQAHLILATTL